jgi:hypothetical protein
MDTAMKRLLVVMLLIVSARANAATLATSPSSGATRILLPICSRATPGADGSLWTTEIWVRNDSDEMASLSGLTYDPPFLYGHVTQPLDETILFMPPPPRPPGELITVGGGHADDVHFYVRVRDASREGPGAGTDIPAIRERDLYSDTTSLVNVRFDRGLRLMLRIYGIDVEAPASVRVRLLNVGFHQPLTGTSDEQEPILGERVVDLAADGPTFAFPLYVQLPLDNLFVLPDGMTTRVEIKPLTPGMKFWAFVAATNIETHHVTVIAPR